MDDVTRDQARAFLTRDGGHIPCSRYATNSEDAWPYAYALAEIAREANGDPITYDVLDYYMGLVVNDHDDVESLILGHGTAEHRELIDYPREILHYHAGHNIPGYLPMEDDPATYATYQDARDALLEDMDRHADGAADMDDGALLVHELEAAMEDVRAWETAEDSYTIVTDPTRERDLGTAYWITACTEDECLEGEES